MLDQDDDSRFPDSLRNRHMRRAAFGGWPFGMGLRRNRLWRDRLIRNTANRHCPPNPSRPCPIAKDL